MSDADATRLSALVGRKHCTTVVGDVEALVVEAERDLNTSYVSFIHSFLIHSRILLGLSSVQSYPYVRGTHFMLTCVFNN